MFSKFFNPPAKTQFTRAELELAETLMCDNTKCREYFTQEPVQATKFLFRLAEVSSNAYCRKIARTIMDDDHIIHAVIHGAHESHGLVDVINSYTTLDKARILSRPMNSFYLVAAGYGDKVLEMMKDFTPEQKSAVWEAEGAVTALVWKGPVKAFAAFAPEQYQGYMDEYNRGLEASLDEHASIRNAAARQSGTGQAYSPILQQGPYSDGAQRAAPSSPALKPYN